MRVMKRYAVVTAALCAVGVLSAPMASAAPVRVADSQHVGANGTGSAAVDVVPAVADTLYAMGADTGFAGQEIDTAARAITVYWKGTAPAAVRSYIATSPRGVTVTLVEGAKYSRSENLVAAQRLTQPATAASLNIESVAVNTDGSGVTVRVFGGGRLQTSTARTSAAEVAGTGVTIEAATAATPLATRPNDAPAWKGGARTIQAGGACSTGFAVLKGSAGRLVSANHCDPSANAAVKDGAGQTIAPGGSSVSGKSGIDSQLIDPSASPATTARIYTGAWNSGTTKVVKNWASNWKGQTVCASGATSGQHCGKIVNDATTIPGNTGSFYIEVKASGSSVMAAGGDSGGPVFATVTGGVQARGIILWGKNPVSCGAHNPDVNPGCYNTMRYAPISVVLNSWGVKLEVG